jgi:hypothetical protein
MRIFACILSLAVLALTLNPCIDGPEGNDHVLQKSEYSQNQNTENHQNDTNHCSPFCTCQCCQSNVFVADIPSLATSTAFIITYSEFSPSFPTVDLPGLFNPPKS